VIDLENSDMRWALAERDIGAVFRLVVGGGLTQRELAVLVRMSQSEVSEVLSGRRVLAYDVLVRIADGLGVPRGMMGLAYEVGGQAGEVDEDVKRRAMFAAAGVALFGAPVLGKVLQLPAPSGPTPLPSRLGASDVVAVRKLTEGMRDVARTYGGCADLVTGVADRSRVLLSVPAAEQTSAEMRVAVAELHTMAGWCCVDSGLRDQARAHFATAMDLGDLTGALRHAGIQMVDAGAYNDGLKAFQLALVDDKDNAWLHGETAFPLAAMGHSGAALDALKQFREEPQSDLFDDADMDYVTSAVYRELGQLDRAQAFAASAVGKWDQEGTAKRDRVEADIMLATLHVDAGDSYGPMLTRRALAGVAPLRSVRSRAKLSKLVAALEARPDSTCRDLAHQAREIRQRV
jgi:transcriptional regulator with XRE-family HTH domain